MPPSLLWTGWQQWTDWSACSKSCDTGTQNRNRDCVGASGFISSATECGSESDATESQDCNTQVCPGNARIVAFLNSYFTTWAGFCLIFFIQIIEPVECPADFPFATNDGAHCCKYYTKNYNSASQLCNGGPLMRSDPLECCEEAQVCSDSLAGCKDQSSADGTIDNINS